MNRQTKRIITGLILLLLLGMALYPKIKPLFNKGGKGQPTSMAGRPSQGMRSLNVTGYVIAPRELNEVVRASGTLVPNEETDLAFETSGRIVAIQFTEGSHVTRGDLLAKINDSPLKAQLQKLEVTRKLSQDKEFRHRELLKKNAISQENYDQVAGELETVLADIALVQARISETELRAPFDGVIGLRYLSEGSYITPATKIVKLISTKPLKIEFSIPERYAYEIGIGYPVTFSVDGSNRQYQASVYAVNPKVDLDTRTIVIRALYPNTNEEHKSGRYASVTLQRARINNAIAIPSEALIPEMDGEKVFVFIKGKASSRKVETGLRTEDRIQITQGLNFGDTLLTSGILQLREGLPVVLDTVITSSK